MEIADGIHLIKNPHRTYFVSSCLIVGDGLTLVDAGRRESPEATIYPYIRMLGRDPSQISRIILTHAHWDHCAGATQIKRDTGCEIAIHSHGKTYLENPKLVERELAERFPGLPLGNMADFDAVKADMVFSDGETIDLDGRKLKVVHTPGHSACSCCIVDEDQGTFMAGDSIQGRGEGRPLIFHSVKAYVNSMRRLLEEPINVMVNGHPFPPFGKVVLRGKEAYRHIEESLSAVEELGGRILKTLEEATRPISLMRVHEAMGASRPFTIGCMLEALEADGKVRRETVEG